MIFSDKLTSNSSVLKYGVKSYISNSRIDKSFPSSNSSKIFSVIYYIYHCSYNTPLHTSKLIFGSFYHFYDKTLFIFDRQMNKNNFIFPFSECRTNPATLTQTYQILNILQLYDLCQTADYDNYSVKGLPFYTHNVKEQRFKQYFEKLYKNLIFKKLQAFCKHRKREAA